MRGIALSFFEIGKRNFPITVYRRRKSSVDSLDSEQNDTKMRRLPERIRPNEDAAYLDYWVSLGAKVGFDEFRCDAFTNIHMTSDVLHQALIDKCQDSLDGYQYEVIEGFSRRVSLILDEHDEGTEVVWLEPYLLKNKGKFGFLCDFKFNLRPEYEHSRHTQQLSLSLDQNFRSNRNYYADRFAKVADFVKRFHSTLFPFQLGNTEISVDSRLTEITPFLLDTKTYITGDDRPSNSQFIGIKQNGPLRNSPANATVYFLFMERDRPLSYDLYRALRGETFPTFPGFAKMFHHQFDNNSVRGVPIEDFSLSSIEKVRDSLLADAGEKKILPVLITPFSKEDDESKNEAYWIIKHSFLSKDIPSQVVSVATLRDRNKLKWSISNIALQMFAKLGGVPWKVEPRKERCLTVGIGQAHREVDYRIEKYFAYSILTDSSGQFEEIHPLGEAHDENVYLADFKRNLTEILLDYAERFDSIAIHTTFAIRYRELEAVKEVLDVLTTEYGNSKELVALKFDENNKFFAYSIDHNSRIPYESSVVQLSSSEYLMWFEGLQYQNPNVQKSIRRPVHVRFDYPREGLTEERRRGYLQDALNMSGANWRGFNAKSSPVSVLYAKLVAQYYRHFESLELPPADLRTITPWFL